MTLWFHRCAGNITVRGLSQHVANTEEEALTLFFEGEANRVVAEHTLNSASSRYVHVLVSYISVPVAVSRMAGEVCLIRAISPPFLVSCSPLFSSPPSSHCVFQVMVESRSRIESAERAVRSKLNLVDLAGSERVGKTNSQGTTLKEAGCELCTVGDLTVDAMNPKKYDLSCTMACVLFRCRSARWKRIFGDAHCSRSQVFGAVSASQISTSL